MYRIAYEGFWSDVKEEFGHRRGLAFLWNELRHWPAIWISDIRENTRKRGAEPRLWVNRWEGNKYVLKEEQCSSEIDRVMVYLGMVESRSEAQRLIKSGSVEYKDAFGFGVWRKIVLKETLPLGLPVALRFGKRCYGIQTVMLPQPDQRLYWWGKEING